MSDSGGNSGRRSAGKEAASRRLLGTRFTRDRVGTGRTAHGGRRLTGRTAHGEGGTLTGAVPKRAVGYGFLSKPGRWAWIDYTYKVQSTPDAAG